MSLPLKAVTTPAPDWLLSSQSADVAVIRPRTEALLVSITMLSPVILLLGPKTRS